MTKKYNSGNTNYVPLAILGAGLLIATAIFMKSDAPRNQLASVVAFDMSALPALAQQVGLDKDAFGACLDSGRYAEKVASSIKEASSLGAQGTPFPIIITPEGKTIVLPGAVPFDQLQPLFEVILAGEAIPDEIVTDLPNLRAIDNSDYVLGNPDATIKIIEYSDLDCPFCKVFHNTMKKVVDTYGTDNVTWVFRHLPLESLHPDAAKQAEALECAGELAGADGFYSLLVALFEAKK